MNMQVQAASANFEDIWQEYYPRLMIFVTPFFKGRQAEREDAVQEILIRIFNSLGKYNSRYSLSTWIYRIARNYCIDRTRHFLARDRLQQNCLSHFQDQGDLYNPEKQALTAELKAKLRSVIGELDGTDQQICFLYYFEDLKYRDIRQVLEIPVGTLKYRMYQIRGRIKKKMEGYYGKAD